MIHEVGHALGFYHEHQRPDRDEYVTVYENNVIEGKIPNNYNLLEADAVNLYSKPYDYMSTMHYGPQVIGC